MENFPYTDLQLAWLHDLETTEIGQAERYLFKDNKYCCLGRACLIAGFEFDKKRVTNTPFVKGHPAHYSTLPTPVWQKLQLRDKRGGFDGEPVISDDYSPLCTLAELNDAGWTFKRIAAFVRARPQDVFTNLEL